MKITLNVDAAEFDAVREVLKRHVAAEADWLEANRAPTEVSNITEWRQRRSAVLRVESVLQQIEGKA